MAVVYVCGKCNKCLKDTGSFFREEFYLGCSEKCEEPHSWIRCSCDQKTYDCYMSIGSPYASIEVTDKNGNVHRFSKNNCIN